jgi:hypothetical protein
MQGPLTQAVILVSRNQGCQMVFFDTKKSNLGIFLRALEWKTLVYFMDIWNIVRTFGTFWYSVPRKIWQPCPQHGTTGDTLIGLVLNCTCDIAQHRATLRDTKITLRVNRP